jgi:glycosyltransferase involved in cell wall biosynthesis
VRVLHVCPLWHEIRPDTPGGIETLLSALIPALERRGCESLLVAAAGSEPRDRVITAAPAGVTPMMHAGVSVDYAPHEQAALFAAIEAGGSADVIHSHLGTGGFVLSAIPSLPPVLHTFHSPITPDVTAFAEAHPDVRFSAVSRFQADRLRRGGGCRVVGNGIDVDAFPFSDAPDDTLLFLGRLEPAKGPDLAMDAASAVGRPLVLAGPVIDEPWFESTIAPRLGDEFRYVGVADDAEKKALLGSASCVLAPIRWDEPFGLVAVEAMACGTPVVGSARGALPEIIESGITGEVARETEALPASIGRAVALDRGGVRARAAQRFDLDVVADEYVRLYEDLLAGVRW